MGAVKTLTKLYYQRYKFLFGEILYKAKESPVILGKTVRHCLEHYELESLFRWTLLENSSMNSLTPYGKLSLIGRFTLDT